MTYSTAKAELDIMSRLHQMPASPKELREAMPYTPNQILWVLNALRADGLVKRIEGTHLMRVVDV
jgi:DNA-binding MarR family transcriptional regulator